jgi:acyl carrier protein
MNDAPLLAVLAPILQRPEGELTDATEIVPSEWDSVQLLDLIAAIDDSYGITVPTESVHACRTIGDLRALVAEAAAKA